LYKFTKFAAIISLITGSLFFLVRTSIPPEVLNTVENNFLPWLLEIVQNDNGGKLETRSSNELKTMYFVPAPKTAIFGDGHYVNPMDPNKYYLNTDGGYMRHLLFYGIIGCTLLVVLYLLIFYQMHRLSRALNGSVMVKLFIFLIAVYYFLSHIKGDLLTGSNMPLKALFLLYALLISFYKDPAETEPIHSEKVAQ